MFGRREKSLGDYLREESPQPLEVKPGAKVEATAEKSYDQIATERMQFIKTKATAFKDRLLDYGSRFAKMVLTPDVQAKRAAKATKEGVAGGAKFMSEKSRQIHDAGVERVGATIEKGKTWADQKSQALDAKIDSGIKLYEKTKSAMKDKWREMQKSALQERRLLLLEELAEIETKLGESNA